MPLPDVVRRLHPPTSVRPSRHIERTHLALVRRGVDRVARRRTTRMQCLVRSIVAWRLLRERGVPANVVLGVQRHDAELRGHAWVELDGHALWEQIHGVWTPTWNSTEVTP